VYLTKATLTCLCILFITTKSFATEICSPPPGAEQILQYQNIDFIIFGELHGTVESPAIFAELVCLAVISKKTVLVGIEFPEFVKEAFQTFLISKGTAEDESRFLSDSLWTKSAVRFPDGRTSKAMLDMIKRLRELYEAGYKVSIATFTRPRAHGESSQTPYEKGLAASLMEANEAGDYEVVLALTGRLHAAKTIGRLPFEPMAMHLPQDSTLTIALVGQGGSAWNCKPECGPHDVIDLYTNPEGSLTIDRQLFPRFDGSINLGLFSASLPVNIAAKLLVAPPAKFPGLRR
jgi:hypothetical protein